MAGHDGGRGLVVASALAKIIGKVDTQAVKDHVGYEEWHRSSKAFNAVGYYDPERFREALDVDADPSDDDIAATLAIIATTRAETKARADARKAVVVHEDCKVEWIEWSGSLRRPKAEERVGSGARVEVRGRTATIIFADGKTMQNRLTTRGFSFESDWTESKRQRAADKAERERRRAERIERVKIALAGKRIERTKLDEGKTETITLDEKIDVLIEHLDGIEAGAEAVTYGNYKKRVLRFVPDRVLHGAMEQVR